jgi:hypothetical protein
MANLSGIVKQLKKERDRVEQQLSGLNAALAAFADVYRETAKPERKRRKLSAKFRAKIAAAGKSIINLPHDTLLPPHESRTQRIYTPVTVHG